MEDNSPKMPFMSHFTELRNRLLVSVIVLAIAVVVSFAFSQKLAEVLAKPIGGLEVMTSIDLTENVSAFMKISLLSGVVLALPVILYEILAFIMPGLNPKERFWIWLALPTATLFFAGGVAFAYFFMLPTALPFLLNFMGIATSPRPSTYFGFVTNLLFWVGVSFELPLLVFVLAKVKVVTAKQLIKQWRIAIVASAILAALITPTPDPVNMGLMMLPLAGLYVLSIIFATIARWERKPKEKKKMSKRKRILVTVLSILIIAAIAAAVSLWPSQTWSFLSAVWAFLTGIWQSIAAFFTRIKS